MSILSTKLDEISSTIPVILITVKTVPQAFTNWLKSEMEARNWGIRETAAKVGVSHPTISDILTNGKTPSLDTIKALAKTFRKKDVTLLRLAEMIDQEPEYIPW